MRLKRRPLGMGVMAAVVAMLAMAVGASAAFGYSEFKTTGKFPVTIKGKRSAGSTITLESESGASISCENSSMAGSIESSKRLKATLTLSGKCEVNGKLHLACGSSIVTKELTGEPGENLAGAVVGKTTEGGLIFRPTSGGDIAEYACGSSVFTIAGGVICKTVAIGELYNENEFVCKQTSSGEQEFTSIEVGGKVLEEGLKIRDNDTGLFEAGEKDALGMSELLQFSAEVEQTA